jgi:hypothetical protein
MPVPPKWDPVVLLVEALSSAWGHARERVMSIPVPAPDVTSLTRPNTGETYARSDDSPGAPDLHHLRRDDGAGRGIPRGHRRGLVAGDLTFGSTRRKRRPQRSQLSVDPVGHEVQAFHRVGVRA